MKKMATRIQIVTCFEISDLDEHRDGKDDSEHAEDRARRKRTNSSFTGGRINY